MNIRQERIQDRIVRDLVIEMPEAMQIFERAGIDYCCGGQRTLQESCQVAGRDVDEIIALITAVNPSDAGKQMPDWQHQPLTELMTHIVEHHHAFTRDELARLEPLMSRVQQVHAGNHPELSSLQVAFSHLKEDLITHMLREEQVLFPFIARMEEAVRAGAPVPPPFFKTVRNPVRMMMSEHDTAGDLLRQMRQLSDNFKVPADGCFSFQSLYRGLEALETDLHQHIHLENNILFPRATEMEERAVPEIRLVATEERAHSCFNH